MRVLVVDDFPDVAEALKMLIELRGFECRIACTVADALAVADSFDPDIAILDIQLPDGTGYELARELRRRTGRRVYLAALTGWANASTRAHAFAAGFDQHFLKPTNLATIDQVMRGATASAA